MSVAVAAVLLAVLLPALAQVRASARRAASLANLRTHAQVMTKYAGDFGDRLPYVTARGFMSTPVKVGPVELSVSYFDAFHTWHVALAEPYYSVSPRSDIFFPPKYKNDPLQQWPLFTAYQYPCVFLANPRYWNEHTRLGPSQYRPVLLSEVAFPSRKVLVAQSWFEPGARRTAIPTAFVDGSARPVPEAQRLSGYDRGDGYPFAAEGAVHYQDEPAFLHTVDGARGFDVP